MGLLVLTQNHSTRTMKIHQIVGLGKNELKARYLSCFCDSCFNKNTGEFSFGCDGWISHCVVKRNATIENEDQNEGEHENELHDIEPEPQVNAKIGDFVAAIYEGQWYIGQILEEDNVEKEFLINFMESDSKTSCFKWPKEKDRNYSFNSSFLVSRRNLGCL